MNSETPPLSSPSDHTLQRGLDGVVSDSRRRQLDIFRQRELEKNSEPSPFEGGSSD